jgi:hypothetical protein
MARILRLLKKNPLTTTLPAGATSLLGKVGKVAAPVGLGLFGLEVAEGLFEGFKSGYPSAGMGDHSTAMDLERNRLKVQQEMGMRVKRLEALRQRNVAAIMQFAPDLAASLLAGRRLPQEGIAIGGRKREDLLGEVALMMSQGGMSQQQ